MSISLASTAAMPPSGGPQAPGASQNLFEHMANGAKGMPEGASPHQIGESLMQRLDGFIDRSRNFSARAETLGQAGTQPAPPAQSPSSFASVAGEGGRKVGDPQMDRIVQSLGRMFDYSIETQMVVRGATQVSGSANTLLKGQ
ncbi:hypothetical protein ACQKPE_11640 [Pseudomonas sp. NPDC089554]|uniref:hypothetical protein n=1 Tax=Pseudomonas sp. NPDC089554 TaxID=3390653 RepID=UPI003D076227